MAREISTRLTVDGEQEYKRAIKEASKSISEMGAQLTLATAQYKADGDSMKLMSSRSKVLKEEIKQQQEIVKSLEGAVKEVTDRYGENSKEAEKWEAQLARAQAKLINLQHELDNNDKGLDKNGKAFAQDTKQAQGFGSELTTLDKIQKNTTFQALNTALEKVGAGFQSVLAKGKQFTSYVWGIASDASTWADDLATESTKLGISVETLQGWMDAAHLVDTEVSTMKSALVKLTDPTQALEDAMKALGIHTKEVFSVVDQNGAVDARIVNKSAVDLLWETVDALSKETDATKRNNLAKELFGKSYMDMLPLIKAGKEGWDAYVQSAEESGRVLDEGQVNKLTTFNDAIQEFNAQMEAFKHTISAEIAPGMTTITEAGTKFLQEMTKWAQSEEGQKKLTELSASIAGLVESLATEDNFNRAVATATGAINALTGALTWIIDNKDLVVGAIGAIAGAFAAMKVAEGAVTILQAANALKNLVGGGGGGTTPTATGGGGGGTTPTATGGGGGLLTFGSLFAKAGSFLKGAGTVGLEIAPFALAIDGMIHDQLEIAAANEAAAKEVKRLEQVTAQYDASGVMGNAGYKELFETMNSPYTEGTTNPFASMVDRYMAWMHEDAPDAMIDAMAEIFDDKGGPLDELWNQWADLMERYAAGENVYDTESVQKLWETMREQVEKAGETILQEAIGEAQSTAGPDAEAAGEAVSDSVAVGIESGIPAAVNAAGKLMAAVNRVISAGSSRPGVTVAGGTYNGQTYNSSRSIYIDKYNQYSGADVSDLLGQMEKETRYTNMGMGA